MTTFEGPVRHLPEPVTRDEALRGLTALAFLHDSGRLADREAIIAADNIFIDMGLGHLSLPFLQIDNLTALDFLCALRSVLTEGVDIDEPFQLVGARWPFTY